MIIDDIAHAERYACLSANFARAIRFLTETRLDELPCGTIAIDGENVFANLQENMTRTDDLQFEAHDRYADIQVILRGTERFALGWDASIEPPQPGSDFRRCQAERWVDFVLAENQFVIFLPGEAHAPGNAVQNSALCRKLVVKVLCDCSVKS